MATGVQEVDVWAAADALLHAGEQPTIEKVRLHLGRGSPNTVGPHLKTWFRGLSERLIAGPGGESGIPEAVTRAVGQVWETALAAARDEWTAAVALERTELIKAREAFDTDRAALMQAQERLQAREADLQASTQAAHAQAAAAEARLQAAEQQVKEGTHAVKHVQAQLAAAQEQLDTLQQTLQTAQTSHQAALATAEARHATHERRWLGEIDEQRQALKRVQDELTQQRKAATRREAEQTEVLVATRKETQDLAATLVSAQAAQTRLTLQIEADQATSRAVQHGLQQRHNDLESRLEDLRGQLEVKDTQIAALTQQLTRQQTTFGTNAPN